MGHGRPQPDDDESLEVVEARAAAKVDRARRQLFDNGARQVAQDGFVRVQGERARLEEQRDKVPAGLRRAATRQLDREEQGYRAMNSALLRLERVDALDFRALDRAVESFRRAEAEISKALNDRSR